MAAGSWCLAAGAGVGYRPVRSCHSAVPRRHGRGFRFEPAAKFFFAWERRTGVQADLMKTRDNSVDILRGFAIVLVVLGHVIRGLLDGSAETNAGLKLADWIIYSVHMPVFFYLAGYFTQVSLDRATRREYLRSRASNVLYPYLIWSVIYFVAGAIMSHVTHLNHPITPGDLTRIGWDPITVLWFLYALLVMQVVAALTARWPTALLAGALVLDVVFSIAGWLDTTGVAGRVVAHAPFFFLGFVMAQRRRSVLPGVRDPLAIAAVLAVAFGVAVVAGCLAGVDAPIQAGTIPIALAGGAALALLSVAIARRGRSPAARMLEQLGRASLGIYLLHVLVLATVPRLLRASHLETVPLTLVLGTVIGTGGSYLAFKLLERARLAPYLKLR